ncbi:hypothetical protein [Stenotrophomonas sp. MMGLT7]|uniref:hypothetical protein n=1 Tax=Stenotrophomonas sp. MMGLT7 TaxID=2901227 RepID=UPI001E3CE4CA|nr:hypothetical protein [Stenotrophomonas sp. MMGLT7]MCD7098503.1 hypothetical protein [Stenotrophomonas sp. MMGLT7]
MHWLFLLLAVGALILAFSTPHMSLLVLSLLAALVLLLLWIRGWYLQRVGDSQGDAATMVDPAELRRLREAAAARKAVAAASEPIR